MDDKDETVSENETKRVALSYRTVLIGVGDSYSCRASCPAELYESRGMTAYDVLMDVHALYWIADGTGGVLVSLCRVFAHS